MIGERNSDGDFRSKVAQCERKTHGPPRGQSAHRTAKTTISEISPPNSTSERKCPPNAIRNTLAATPNASAPATAGARNGGGASRAGATIQNADEASPEAKPQFFLQAPSKRYQGRNSSCPPNP